MTAAGRIETGRTAMQISEIAFLLSIRLRSRFQLVVVLRRKSDGEAGFDR